MMLIQSKALCIDLGIYPILNKAEFTLDQKEKVCLVGRNGVGKSTLLKLISRQIDPDSGEIIYRNGMGISQLEQDLPGQLDRTVKEVIEEGLASVKALLDHFNLLSDTASTNEDLKVLDEVQQEVEARGGWHIDQKVESIIDQLNLPAHKKLTELSGGWRRRVMLGKALVSQPDLLLLDEPTNHLDINTIDWLEEKIINYAGAVLFVTHDRFFLNRVATRILEIDRGKLVSFPGNYERYLDLKEKMLEDEATHNALFDKRLADEEVWIRQGIKARRTRNEGRVRALESLRVERSSRVDRAGKASVVVQAADQSGKKVIEADNVSFSFGTQKLVDQFSLTITRGDRIGLIGNNGLGKSTLLKILLGELAPQQGKVKIGTSLEIAYFDQMHRELNLDKTIIENIGDGQDYVMINGERRHMIGYLSNFLFSPKRAMTPVSALSGGEKNRVLLAKLFAKPSNLLILDEPTNDLDIEMLEVLEEQLVNYKGTLIIVSHDRNFLDNVVTSTLVFEGEGQIGKYVGGYSDWLKRGKALGDVESPFKRVAKESNQKNKSPVSSAELKQKLSYNEQKQLELLPKKIAELEKKISIMTQKTHEPSFYGQSYQEMQNVLNPLAETQKQLDEAMALWVDLEERQ